MAINLNVYFHGLDELEQINASLATIKSTLSVLITQGAEHMATSRELLDMVNAVATEVGKLPAAVDALEAKITEALAKLGTIPPDVQADIDAAVATLQGVASGVAAALADAADGVDEAVPPPANG